jgi:UDP-N-acetyl-D-mannosaminuronic acid dehydrogenase
MNNLNERICIMGLGYIGLPTAALLANRRYHVHGVDVNQSVVDTINKGEIHIVEPDLDTFVKSAVSSGYLKASTQPCNADVFIIAVPTPFKENHIPDISYIEHAIHSIAPFLRDGNSIILESTSPVGTTEKIKEILDIKGIQTQTLNIAHCPERVLPGRIMIELIQNDRIVGGLTPRATENIAAFYRDFVIGKVLETDAKSAEMSKLVENSSRDVQIAFANELSMICDKLELDVWEVIKLANHHPRVNILNPGTGVGGHCIAVDPWFIVNSDEVNAILIRTARERNLQKTEWVLSKIIVEANKFKKNMGRSAIIACMGIAFKPDIDDLRESPALHITQKLVNDGYNIIVVEPNIKDHKTFLLKSIDECTQVADIIVYLVSHKEFKIYNI